MYADNITESMQRTIDETARRRTIQLQYNADHNITPRQIVKAITSALPTSKETEPTTSMQKTAAQRVYIEPEGASFAADPIVRSMSKEELQKSIANTTALMKQAAKDLDFMQAAQYRDEIIRLQKELEEKEFTASAGGGAVEVTVTGKREITKVHLEEEVVDPEDIEMLEDLIMAAVNEALRKVEEETAASMSKLTGGIGGLGGLNF